MMGATRRRLSADERRAQLLEIGTRMVADSSFDELSIEAVVEEAAISRGLLFHYFPTRSDFLAAIAAHAADELLRLTDIDPALPALQRLTLGITAFVDYVADRGAAYRSLVRGASASEAELRAIAQRTRDVLIRRLVEGIEAVRDDPLDATAVLALHGWLGFVEEATVTWLAGRADDGPFVEVDRDDLMAMIGQGLLGLAGVMGVPLQDVRAGA